MNMSGTGGQPLNHIKTWFASSISIEASDHQLLGSVSAWLDLFAQGLFLLVVTYLQRLAMTAWSNTRSFQKCFLLKVLLALKDVKYQCIWFHCSVCSLKNWNSRRSGELTVSAYFKEPFIQNNTQMVFECNYVYLCKFPFKLTSRGSEIFLMMSKS